MTEADQKLLLEAKHYVTHIFTHRTDQAFRFHNLLHTTEVVQACELLASHYSISENEKVCLVLAAWFHDTGYSAGVAKNHEEISQRIASSFLLEKMVDPVMIETINNCIAATRVPQSPNTLLEKLLCDADLFHLGTNDFEEKNRLLRQELNELNKEKISKKEWRLINIQFLQNHQYFTSYGREKLEPVKQEHLHELMEKEGKKDKFLPHFEIPVIPEIKEPKATQKEESTEKPKKENNRADRSVATMFRIMSDNHVSLSQMADSKANIMISVNTIVMSIMVSVLLGKLQFYPEYIIPTIILLGVCLSAVIFAILATRPNISRGTFTKEDIENKKINLLFFGNFYNMSLPEYDWAMKEMMTDKEYLNSSMIKDIYFLGVVLARKYKYLRLSYNIFMYGLVVGIVAFGISFFLSEQGA